MSESSKKVKKTNSTVVFFHKNNFCKENEITKAEMFRSALNTFYKSNDIIVKHESNDNPNQLRIE